MKFSTNIDSIYVIPLNRFDNERYIDKRISMVPDKDKGSVRTMLKYLYMTDGPINLPHDRFKIALNYIEDEGEKIICKWLFTRTQGKLKRRYGSKALLAARKAKYRCKKCGNPDVRVLNLDHHDGTVANTEFSCLCANCHSIKSREYDWDGKKKYS